jgi:hypothetical protein
VTDADPKEPRVEFAVAVIQSEALHDIAPWHLNEFDQRQRLLVDQHGSAAEPSPRVSLHAAEQRLRVHDLHVPRIGFQSLQNRSDFVGRQANLSDDSSPSGGLRPRCSQV